LTNFFSQLQPSYLSTIYSAITVSTAFIDESSNYNRNINDNYSISTLPYDIT